VPSSDRYCPKCGRILYVGAYFCSGCGLDLLSERNQNPTKVNSPNSPDREPRGKRARIFWFSVGIAVGVLCIGLTMAFVSAPSKQNVNSEVESNAKALCATGAKCLVGDIGPGGGTVFYVDSSPDGFTEVGAACAPHCHYLEAAPTSGTNKWTDSKYPWSRKTSASVNTGSTIGTGLSNTRKIYALDPGPGYAGTEALFYTGPHNLNDWFLPSKDELKQLYLAKATVEGLVGANDAEAGRYWSSSQYLDNAAWIQYFVEGVDAGAQDYEYKNYADSVRPVRAF